MTKLKFNWDGMKKESFEEHKKFIKEKKYTVDDFVGNVRVGDLCFDLVIRDDTDDGSNPYLTYDLYVGGIDTGYGYTSLEYPYDYAEGGAFKDSYLEMSFEAFKAMAEEEMEKFIRQQGLGYKECDLTKKAKENLNIW